MGSIETPTLNWTPPGPGEWRIGRHITRPFTPIAAQVHPPAFREGFATGFSRLGVPLVTIDEQLVNGVAYSRAVPLIDKPGSTPPPVIVLRLAMRLHPEFRRRNKRATTVLEEQGWRQWIEQWHAHDRQMWTARHTEVQEVDVSSLDGDGLAAHLDETLANLGAALTAHFELAPVQGFGLGQLLVEGADRWSLTPNDVASVLAGASPGTTEAIRALDPLRNELAGTPVDSLDEVRAASPQAAQLLETWLDRHGWWMLTGYDLEALTVGEMPSAVLAALRQSNAPQVDGTAAIDAVLTKVPTQDIGRARELISVARQCLALRDAIGPCTAEWPFGLVRRAVLEIGNRSGFAEPDHAAEATADELRRMTRMSNGPSEDELAARRTRRYEVGRKGMPELLGAPESAPPVDAMPPGLALGTRIGLAFMEFEWGAPSTEFTDDTTVARGDGIGSVTISGRARVIYEPRADLELEPGDILVAPCTTPTWSLLLTQAAGLVVEEGGLAAHAAIVARELDIPAVVGARGACQTIPDRARIEVDPSNGAVRLLAE